MRCINDALVLQRKATHSSRQLALALQKKVIFPVNHRDVPSYFIQRGEKTNPKKKNILVEAVSVLLYIVVYKKGHKYFWRSASRNVNLAMAFA